MANRRSTKKGINTMSTHSNARKSSRANNQQARRENANYQTSTPPPPPSSNYETAGPKETQESLKKQFGNGAKAMWERVKTWASRFVSAFKTVGMRFWKGLMYVATRVIEIAGTCIMAIPAILASTAKLVFGILKWTASIITLGVVVVLGALARVVNGLIGIASWVEAFFGRVAVTAWKQTKKTGSSRKLSYSYKTVKETVTEEVPTESFVGPQTQAA